MKCNEYICDICGRHTEEATTLQALIRKWSIINGHSKDVVEEWDLCECCLAEIRKKVQNYDE